MWDVSSRQTLHMEYCRGNQDPETNLNQEIRVKWAKKKTKKRKKGERGEGGLGLCSIGPRTESSILKFNS